jgi:hypothetical protein
MVLSITAKGVESLVSALNSRMKGSFVRMTSTQWSKWTHSSIRDRSDYVATMNAQFAGKFFKNVEG